MKKIITILLYICTVFVASALTKAQCLEDAVELKTHLTLDSISHDNIVRSGRFDYDAAFSVIESGIRNFEGEDISEEEFFKLAYNALRDIPDHHISLEYDGGYFALFHHESFFIGNREDSVKKPVFSLGEPKYISGVYRRQTFEPNDIKTEGDTDGLQEINITSPRKFKIITTQNQMYIRIPSFCRTDFQEDELDRFSVSGKMARRKKMIVFDLTGNHGGDFRFVTRFLCNFFDEPCSESKESSVFSKILVTKRILAKEDYSLMNKILYSVRCAFSEQFFQVWKTDDIQGSDSESKYRIVIIADKQTMSSGECFVQQFRQKFADCTVIGENTVGAFCYGNPLPYTFKNSGITVSVPDFQTAFSDTFPDRLDSDFGLIPDWWCATKGDVLSTLAALDVDDDLLPKIRDFYEDE